MKKTYIVTNPDGANLRTLPSTAMGAVAVKAPHGSILRVISDFTAANFVGETTNYLCVFYNQRYLWVVSTLVAEHTSYLLRAEEAAKKVYGMIVQEGCRHGSGANSYDTMRQKRVTTCASSASAVLQEAGCLPTGKLISHTAAVGSDILKKKDTLDKAATGMGYLIEGTCNVVRVGLTYTKLPAAYKKAGTVYIQDSNVCVSAGDGAIYSCNNSSGELQNGVYKYVRRTGGYPFTSPIIYVIQPNQ